MNEIILHFFTFLIFFGMSIGSSFLVLRMLHKANFKEENFLNNEVITSSGLIFLVFLLFYGVYLYFLARPLQLKGWPASLLIIGFGVGILGFIDDMLGDHTTKGFSGHFGALAKGKVTSGLLKAVFGFALAVLAALMASEGLVNIIVNSLIIALSVNFFNLLDLRPGRSIKAFLFIGIIIFAFSKVSGLLPASLPVLAPVLVVLYLDLQMHAMLGDTGSNFLGGLTGLYVIYSFGLKVNSAVLLGLIMVHLYSEKHSISTFISNNSVLRWLDNLGLKREV